MTSCLALTLPAVKIDGNHENQRNLSVSYGKLRVGAEAGLVEKQWEDVFKRRLIGGKNGGVKIPFPIFQH